MGRFSIDLSRFVQRCRVNPRLVVQKVVLDIGTRIVEKTPVGDPSYWKMAPPAGYVGGRARGSWQYAKGAPNTQDPHTVDGSGAASLSRVQAGVAAGDAADQHFITNSVPYIRRLEYDGWSRQAPEGMVRLTIADYQTFVAQAVAALP